MLATPLFEHVLVDEAQDLDGEAINALKRIAGHVTVCMDGNQQLFETGVPEPVALAQLGLSRHNVSLLSAFRCNPMVTQLAAQFVTDVKRRDEFLRQAANPKMDRATPLLYLSTGFAWLRQADLDGQIARFLNPQLTPSHRTVAQAEDWILGVG